MSDIRIDGVKYVPQPEPTKGKTLLDALEVRFDHPDLGDDITIRRYLCDLLGRFWAEQERFDVKRPFNSSDWEFDMLFPLAKAGFLDLGPFDEDGNPYCWTREQINLAHAYVHDLITAAFFGAEE